MTQLYQHQIEGAAWLMKQPRAYLGDHPGTGKTRTLLAAVTGSWAIRVPLVVCPAIVRTHWEREAALFPSFAGAQRLIVKSYDEIARGGNALMKTLLNDDGVDALVLDEAHYCKHATSQRTKQLLGPDGYARRLPTVWAASGTPVPKHAAEFWTILSALFPEVVLKHGIRTSDDFIARFCVTSLIRTYGGRLERKARSGMLINAAEFRAILDEVMLVRTLADVGTDVPPLDVQVLRLDAEMTAEARKDIRGAFLLASQYKGALADLEHEPYLAKHRRLLGEIKVGAVVSLLCKELCNSDEKLVVFTYHRSVLDALRTGLASFGVAYVDGDTSQWNRGANIDQFQTDPDCRVFIGQNIACQTGITLTAASRVILVEPEWTAAVNLQLAHRIRRIGQTSARCVVQMIALAGTLDEAIVAQNARETKMLLELEATT